MSGAIPGSPGSRSRVAASSPSPTNGVLTAVLQRAAATGGLAVHQVTIHVVPNVAEKTELMTELARLQTFLYTLLRDDVVAGRAEELVRDAEKVHRENLPNFSNGPLADYAGELALRLSSMEAPKPKVFCGSTRVNPEAAVLRDRHDGLHDNGAGFKWNGDR